VSEFELIQETAAALFGEPELNTGFRADVWSNLEEAGLTLVGIPEKHGGSGGTIAEAAVVVRAAASAAAMLPIGETAMLGGWLLASAGHDIPSGPLTACVLEESSLARKGGTLRLRSRARDVPWAHAAARIAVVVGSQVVSVDPTRLKILPGENLAGEPRDEIEFDLELAAGDVRTIAGLSADEFALRGAFMRSVSIAGALESAAALTFDLVRRREQFGRPLSAFQAVQQQIAELAAEVAATVAAVDAAVESEDPVRVAVAKVQADRGATVGARISHQLHGAVGMTHECRLHLFTRRLWSWRDEYGTEAIWAADLGHRAARADGLWRFMTAEAVTA
jgi:acyl-CoA dehydrogenase